MTRARWIAAGAAFAAAAVLACGVTVALPGCQQTPVNVPVRTFERAQKVDVVCMKVYDDAGRPQAPQPVVQSKCAPVPPGYDQGVAPLPYHLYALVTQTTRGEIAVVDLTAGGVIDLDHATPGINFIPVGDIPTDIAVAPDGEMTFVGSAQPNKFAVYGIINRDVLGDSQGLPPDETHAVPRLTSWPVCALPEAPGAIVIVPHEKPTPGGPDYDVAVIVPGNDRTNAKLVTLDPRPFLRGAGIATASDGGTEGGAGGDAGGGEGGAAIAPGSLAPCPIRKVVELAADVSGSGWTPGPTWSDGVTWVDGGVDLSHDRPAAPACGVPVPAGGGGGGGDAGAPADSGAPAQDAGDDAGDGGELPFAPGPERTPQGTWVARDGSRLYVADQARPVIHVIDVSDGAAPQELAPLVATSIVNPARKVTVGPLAVSPATRDYTRYLYAVDQKEGSLMVFDVSSDAAPHVPLQRPHAELNPFQEPDRIQFSVPVATVAFARHDFTPKINPPPPGALTGLLCNPNPNVGLAAPYKDPGGYYRNDAPGQDVGLGPFRLRGIFAFATLTNGEIVTIDVDDWDAPCRRPDPMDAPQSSLAVPEPAASGATDIDPYHVPRAAPPNATTTPVSLESFFPVSAPNRPRSSNVLRRDPSLGIHIPYLAAPPTLFVANASVASIGPNSVVNALLLPVRSPFPDANLIHDQTGGADPTDPSNEKRNDNKNKNLDIFPNTSTLPNVRFAFEDPQAHIDQDWTVTYEGALPGFDGLALTVTTDDAYQTMSLGNPGALLCRRGVEDARLGAERAQAVAEGAAALGITAPVKLADQMADYVQVVDDALPPEDDYWKAPNDCWDSSLDTPAKRHDMCTATYGASTDETLSVQRDFPILEAYDDHLVIGRYGYPAGQTPTVQNRVVVKGDPGNAPFLKLMRCCYHNQIHFKVRTGAEWVAVGSSVGYLHHVLKDSTTGACVQSCETREELLNARSPAVPRPPQLAGAGGDAGAGAGSGNASLVPDRNSPLAMRNPMFAYVIWNGLTQSPQPVDAPPPRDAQWKFSTRGQFVPQTVNLASNTTAVAPQSMLFIESLQQLAVVDGSSQGLVLIDLNLVTTAHAPYF